MLPNFLVLGAPRSGTTWLHAVLCQHPDVHVPDSKEPDFLNRRILTEPFSVYTRLFDPAPGQRARRLRGDMSVNYSNLLDPVVRQIARLLPDAKLIFTVRHPVDRFWSSLKYTYGTFSNRVLSRTPVVRFLRSCHSPRFTRRNDYLAVMRRWSAAFGADRLHVDLFDRIESDPRGYVRDVLAHLGADTTWDVPEELLDVRIHSTAPIEMPAAFRWYLTREWLEPTRRLNDALDGRVSHWVAEMEQVAAEVTPSRRMLRLVNRTILSLPDRLAYAAYDARRNAALERRFHELLPTIRSATPQPVAAPEKVLRPRPAARRSLHDTATGALVAS
jgi:hypothetical protein